MPDPEEEKVPESGARKDTRFRRKKGTRVHKQKRYQLTEEEKTPESRNRKGISLRRKKRHQSPETEKVSAYGGRKSARVRRKKSCFRERRQRPQTEQAPETGV